MSGLQRMVQSAHPPQHEGRARRNVEDRIVFLVQPMYRSTELLLTYGPSGS